LDHLVGAFAHAQDLTRSKCNDGIRCFFDVFYQVRVKNQWLVIETGEADHKGSLTISAGTCKSLIANKDRPIRLTEAHMTLFHGLREPSRTAQIQTPGEARRQVHALSTFEEERQEVLASVLQSLAVEVPDPDRTAACFQLLRHLTGPHRTTPYR
jgi:hypothetical protein